MNGCIEVDVLVPNEFIGLVIGRNGRNIRQFATESETEIQCTDVNVYEGTEQCRIFKIRGFPPNCEKARSLIRKCMNKKKMNRCIEVDVPVPNEFIGLVIGRNGRNIRQLATESETKIQFTDVNVYEGTEECRIFKIRGFPPNCEKARSLIRKCIEEKNMDKYAKLEVPVEKKYIGLILGKHGDNRKHLETKSDTRIHLITSQEDEGEFQNFTIIGSRQNCERARSLIREKIIACKDYMSRKELGGENHFVCFNTNDEDVTVKFELKNDNNTPKLDGFMKGERYRIEIENQTDSEVEFCEDTISRIQDVLLTSLRHLHQVKDEEQLNIDLWCHFGKVFVHNVYEGEEKRGLTVNDLTERLGLNSINSIDKNKSSCELDESVNNEDWKATFGPGVDPSHINDDILPEGGDTDDKPLHHVHTQWRYDYAFLTLSGRYIRLKLWEGLRVVDKKPVPPQVKNLLKPVFLEGEEDNLVAWLCYPSTTMVKGEIMTPASKYDCRLKLRTGKRFVSQETEAPGCEEEDKILSDYISKCTLDKKKHHLHLPSSELPEGFQCSFYRSSKESILSCDGENEEKFTVVVMDEAGWDSDSKEKRRHKQFGIRVVLDSWSDALLSGQWEPDKVMPLRSGSTASFNSSESGLAFRNNILESLETVKSPFTSSADQTWK